MLSRNFLAIEHVKHEFAQEKASAFGRLGRALEHALGILREFDMSHEREMLSHERRRHLVEQASVALWYFAVQREACGLRSLQQVLRDYRVPAEVIARMGVSGFRNQGFRQQQGSGAKPDSLLMPES